MSIVKLENVSKQLGEKTLLDYVSFTFETGKKYVITGRSGVGKTTLLNIIAEYLSYQGEIHVATEKIAYMFQDDLLFANLTVMENLEMARIGWQLEYTDRFWEKTKDILKLLQIDGFLDTKVGSLSGGEKKRVALAQGLMLSPQLFLLDEPVAALDPHSRRLVIKAINAVKKNTTIIIVTHEDLKDPTFIKLKLKKGKLLYEGE